MVWYVRLYHEGKERRIGSYKNKTEARDFYEKAKQGQKMGRFFPERYQSGGYDLIEEPITAHVAVSTVKNQSAEQHYGAWWIERMKGKRLSGITPAPPGRCPAEFAGRWVGFPNGAALHDEIPSSYPEQGCM
jgi:hypothetical protein